MRRQREYTRSVPNDMDTVFLFGAGASHGCGAVAPHRPPLGRELYDRLCQSFPESWGSLPSDVADAFGADFETGMDRLWKGGTTISALPLQHMGVYMARFRPAADGGTLYTEVVRRLVAMEADGVLLATLNYDCLLDGEIAALKRGVNYLFPPGKGVLLLKLHGSCNWMVEFEGFNRYVHMSADVRLEGPLRAVDSLAAVEEQMTGDSPLHPVMCLYTEDKPAPLCPDFFEHLHKEWATAVSSARRVGIVGVHPYPRDTHIWRPLAATKAELICIGNHKAYDHWHTDTGRTGPTTVVGARFDSALNSLWERMFS
jgi:hypothetical protein